jgi:DNA polymerase III subunit epsilon
VTSEISDNRKLVCVDVESTGTQTERDRIIELAIVDDQGEVLFSGRFRPGIPIPPEASAVHKIFDADVKDCPSFTSCAKHLSKLLNNVDILGFGVSHFDMAILDAEFARSGVEWHPGGLIIDIGTIYKKLRPRTLSAAVQEFLNRPHEEAHGALGDVQATLEVYRAMTITEEPLRGQDRAGLAKFSQYGEMPYIDIAGKLVRDAAGYAVYNFGKSKGTRLIDDAGLAEWMLDKDFPANTLRCVREELAKLYPPEPDYGDNDDDWFQDHEDDDEEADSPSLNSE